MGNLFAKEIRKFALALVPLLLMFQSATAAVAVIGNNDLPVNSLTADQVSQIFLGKINALPDGTKITAIDHQDGEAVKDEFYENVVGKTSSQLKAYWAKLIFTGEGVPPKPYSGDKNVKDYVAKNSGAIGYVSAESVDKSVKVLFKK
jgi:ABC-type phosphate transport system substrate-binding protein